MPAALGALLPRLGFDHPAWLLLLAAIPPLFVVSLRSLGDFSRLQLTLQAILRTLALGGVALALAGPSLRRPARAISAVALVDVSDSITDAGLARARAAVAELERASSSQLGPRASRLRVVRFREDSRQLGLRFLCRAALMVDRTSVLADS